MDTEVRPKPRNAPMFDEYGSCVATVALPPYIADQVRMVSSPFLRVDLTRESLTEEEKELPEQKRQDILAQRRKHVMLQIGFVPCGEYIAWLFRVLPLEKDAPARQKVWEDLSLPEQESLMVGTRDTVEAMLKAWSH